MKYRGMQVYDIFDTFFSIMFIRVISMFIIFHFLKAFCSHIFDSET